MSRLAVLTPFAFPAVRGNAVTVARIVRGLRGRGLDPRVWDLSATDGEQVAAEVEAWAPALIHGFHASLVGPLALRLARRLDVPLVMTLTGTDANHDLFDRARASAVRDVLQGAAAVVAFHESIVEQVVSVVPEARARMAVVPQAVCLDTGESFDVQARWALPPERVLFVMPGGIRVVKAPRRPLAPLDAVVAAHPVVRLLYAGPVLDPDEGRALRSALVGRPWARHVGVVPHTQMASLLAQADVVLNCSISEGGMANSVLEAMAMGCAVLAADIPGNRAVVEDEVTGLLFADDLALTRAAARLAADATLRARLGGQGRRRVQERYPPAREIAGYLAIYRRHAGVLTA
jgi:glycosyltransferase involved in cell wall biosynthesis